MADEGQPIPTISPRSKFHDLPLAIQIFIGSYLVAIRVGRFLGHHLPQMRINQLQARDQRALTERPEYNSANMKHHT